MYDIMNYSSNDCQELLLHAEPKFKKKLIRFLMINIDDKKHPKTVIDFVANLKYLLKNGGLKKQELATKSDISCRYIDYLLNYERYPTIEIAEKIGASYGLSGWVMIMPNLDYKLAKSGKLDELLVEFSVSSKETQDFVSNVLHRERKQHSQ